MMSCKDKDRIGMLKDVAQYRKEIQVKTHTYIRARVSSSQLLIETLRRKLLIVLSVRCQNVVGKIMIGKTLKKKSYICKSHYLNNSPKPKDIQFTIM